ncbi:hypothetical protein ACM66B_003302 [Microbotryomycetes sp. NB124-2]
MRRLGRRWRWRRVVIALSCLVLLAHLWSALQTTPSDAVEICLVGNAETNAKALNVYHQWQGRFPSAFYVWGERQHQTFSPVDGGTGHFIALRPLAHEQALPFTDGLWESIKAVTYANKCDYIFTHDDDLAFYTSPRAKYRNHVDELVRMVSKYRPAIAGFPWAVGDARFDGMKELKAVFASKEVAPLTGFDNGMVLYHHSVLPMFFPMSPQGEGGFTGKWTLGAHFLQMFGPMTFREHAIRLNTVLYNNTINMDNVAQGGAVIKDGLAYVPASRHPYEYPLNDAYQTFLKSGMHDPTRRWGRELTSQDTQDPKIWTASEYTVEWILNRLAAFYDVRHPALSRTRLLKSLPATHPVKRADVDGVTTLPDDTKFRIIILTKNRFGSFRRLCDSVRAAKPVQSEVVVNIHIDMDADRTREVDEAYEEYVGAWKRQAGALQAVNVEWHEESLGLRRAVLTSWSPKSQHEFAILLEDDIEVSPHFLQYAENMVRSYVYRDEADSRLVGISLYSPRYNEALERYSNLEQRGTSPVFAYQQPQSWGAVLLHEPWKRFLQWFDAFPRDVDPLVPNSMTNRWPFEKHLAEYYLRWMIETGSYLIYPNLPDGRSYSTNHVEVGTNDKVSDPAGRKIIEAKFTVPLLPASADFEGIQTYPPLSSLVVLSLQDAVVEDLDSLPSGIAFAKSFDKCTLVMPVFSRTRTYMDRVHFYQGLHDRLGQILVLWSKLDVPMPAQTKIDDLPVPLEIVKMDKDSLNNRFFPWPQIKYDCVVQMDDGKSSYWEMPHEHLKYGIDTWRGHFWDNLVGFSHQGRNHITRDVDGKEQTYYSATYLSPERMSGLRPFYSLVLTSGIILHRKYLQMYSIDLSSTVLDIVDQRMNCEDILMNYVVANATEMGPIVIDAWAAPVVDQNNAGLWSRTGHMAARTDCIRRFSQVFGRNPLKYSTTLFPVQHEWTVPGRHHYTLSKDEPFRLACDAIVLAKDEQCALQLPLPPPSKQP